MYMHKQEESDEGFAPAYEHFINSPPIHSPCPEQDSNLHASRHTHLKRARLPFRHLGRLRAENGTRTRDPDLGKVVLYQLSYFRKNTLSDQFHPFGQLRMQK